MGTTAAIDDGYTLEKTFPATNMYPRAWIRFRPLLREAREDIKLLARNLEHLERQFLPIDELKKRAKEVRKEVYAVLAKHTIAWDVHDSKGQALDHASPASWAKVEPHLYEELYVAVCNYGKPEALDPDGSKAADEQERADEGNSGAASVST